MEAVTSERRNVSCLDLSYAIDPGADKMPFHDPQSTKNKILDAAEIIYSRDGVEGLTLRLITEHAGVNLASINYHFGTKETLLQAMLIRLLDPLYNERVTLLRQLESAERNGMRPTHIIAAIILPLMRELTRADQKAHRVAFYLRAASDPSVLIRGFMAAHYRRISEQFDTAFVKSAPRLAPHEALWRSRLFFNAFPGTIGNQNTASMLSELLLRPGITTKDIVVHFGAVLECVTSGHADHAHMETLVDGILYELKDSETLKKLRLTFPLTPEDAPPLVRMANSIEECLASAFRND